MAVIGKVEEGLDEKGRRPFCILRAGKPNLVEECDVVDIVVVPCLGWGGTPTTFLVLRSYSTNSNNEAAKDWLVA